MYLNLHKNIFKH